MCWGANASGAAWQWCHGRLGCSGAGGWSLIWRSGRRHRGEPSRAPSRTHKSTAGAATTVVSLAIDPIPPNRDEYNPRVKVPLRRNIQAITAGSPHTRACWVSGSVWCWGSVTPAGQLGNNSTTDSYIRRADQAGLGRIFRPSPQEITTRAPLQTAASIAGAVTSSGQLGDGTIARPAPVRAVQGLPGQRAGRRGRRPTPRMVQSSQRWSMVLGV